MIKRMKHKKEVDVDSTVVDTCEYKGFTIEVHQLADEEKVNCQPLILKDGNVVRRIYVRSKTPYVSREHFAKRQIDHLEATGDWPEKQGVTV